MKLLAPLLCSISLFAAPSGVYVEVYYDKPVSSNITTDTASIKNDTGESGTVALGYQMNQWRFEAESNYSKNAIKSFQKTKESSKSITKGDLEKTGGMLNVYYSAYNDTQLVSSIGLGAGQSIIKTKDLTIDGVKKDIKKEKSFTYQASVSLGYMIDEDWTWTVKYKYQKMRDIKNQHSNYSLGLRYLF